MWPKVIPSTAAASRSPQRAAAAANSEWLSEDDDIRPYVPRQPEDTILYRVVHDQLDAFIALAEERYERPLPRYVIKAFRAYLQCGRMERGFVRLRCDCGQERLLAFSCKQRAPCPSCSARRMAEQAAHLVDRVLPNVPVRQWVLTLPWEIRLLAAVRPEVLSAMARIFVQCIFKELKRASSLPAAQCGAVTNIHRAGASLNLNVHLHSKVLDGVFTRDERGQVRFHPPTEPLSQQQVERVAEAVKTRAVRWLGRHGYLQDEESRYDSNEAADLSALDACAQLAMSPGVLGRLDENDDPEDFDLAPNQGRKLGPLSADVDGFNVNAAVRIAADDDEGRERLARYCCKPVLSLQRLTLLDDGRIAYRTKYPRRGATHRIMTPLELLGRLAALVPPPRYPLLRYAGVLAPHSSWRQDIVPRLPASLEAATEHSDAHGSKNHRPRPRSTKKDRAQQPMAPPGSRTRAPSPACTSQPTTSRKQSAPSQPAAPPTPLSANALSTRCPPRGFILDFNVLTAKHYGRLLNGTLLAAGPRIDWATLMRRTFRGLDVLECPSCGGRLRPIATITNTTTVGAILDHLAAKAAATPTKRARAPTGPAASPALH